jgi:hypothetical protein
MGQIRLSWLDATLLKTYLDDCVATLPMSAARAS